MAAGVMRVVLVFCLAMAMAGAAHAQAPTHCYTPESQERAARRMKPLLLWPRAEAPSASGEVVLDCTINETRLACAVVEASPSPYPLGEAALAYVGELELCEARAGRMRVTMNFTESDVTPAP